MDPQLFMVLVAGVFGLLAGAGLVWLSGRRGLQAQVDTAVARAESALRGELGQSRERARWLEEERRAEQAALAESRSQADRWRNELDLVRDEVSKLTERAARVPALEEELRRFGEDLRLKTADVLRYSGEAAQKGAALDEQAQRIAPLEARLRSTEQQLAQAAQQLADLRESSGGELSTLRTRLQAERSASEEKLALLVEAKNTLTEQFRNLATEILEEKSKRFAEQNQTAIGQLLDPLRTQLSEFKGKVEEVYVQEGKDRSALSEQVRQLVSLNQALSQDAQNLTLALKGNAKAQGNWGELVLERVLEASGLRKGEEYQVQDSQVREDGSRAQPDVVILLPEERRLVVDSKVSLIAYEEMILAQTDEDRAIATRRHLDSVRNHIKGLSGKQYQNLYGLKSLDFVLMFVPIEPAFMMAVTNDGNLFMDAWEKNVLLVSPSTLLFVVRTVAHLWRQEAQSRNAQDIARRGAELYDKLADFVKDLELVGTKLRQAQDAYGDAHKRLSTGRGNVIRQAEMLRSLGVKPTKSLPAPLLDAALDDDAPEIAPLAVLAASNTARLLPDEPGEAAAA